MFINQRKSVFQSRVPFGITPNFLINKNDHKTRIKEEQDFADFHG